MDMGNIPARTKRKWLSSRAVRFVLLPLLVFGVLATLFASFIYPKYSADYHRYASLAQVGAQHLQNAEKQLSFYMQNPLDAQAVHNAHTEFASASAAFVQVNAGLQSLPALSSAVPVYGARLHAVRGLLSVALELSQAGGIGCDTLSLLLARFHNPFPGGANALTPQDGVIINQNFRQIQTLFQQMITQMRQISVKDVQFDARLSKLVLTFQKEVPAVEAWLDTVGRLLPVVPLLLGIGKATNYLIEVLDSTELRPGGGFIGNYGIATFSGGRLIDAYIRDVELLDDPYEAAGHSIPYPPQYAWFNLAPQGWSFRDSNLEADFPTVAQYGEMNYKREGGDMPVQGVIAITPAFIQHILTLIGPVAVPEYHETITAQNLIDRIHYYQLGLPGDTGPSPDGLSSGRKHFTALLAEHLLLRIRTLPSSMLPTFMHIMLDSLHTKDLQVYFNAPVAEQFLMQHHLASAIETWPGDSLFVVDANLSGNKASSLLTNTIDDQVTLDAAGNATHQVTLRYTWAIDGPTYGALLYRDYARVYIPSDSILHQNRGWELRGVSQAFGHKVLAGSFALTLTQTETVTLIWKVPHAASHDGHGWHYHYILQRQPGTAWTLHWSMKLPPCATGIQQQGGTHIGSPQVVTLTQAVQTDIPLEIDYLCP